MATTRTFQDHDLLAWEVYATGGDHGFSDDPHVVFNCLTQPKVRSRVAELGEDESDAQRILAEASDEVLLDMLQRAREIA